MADEGKARPVSGEIKAGAPYGAPAGSSGDDIVDAEFETVVPVRSETPPAAPAIATPAAPAVGMDMLRRDEAGRPAKPSRGGPAFWVAGIGLAAAAFWVSGGHALVRQSSFLSEPAPQGALAIVGVTSRVDASGPKAVLFVDGEAANEGGEARDLPSLDIAVTGNDGRVTRYRLGTGQRSLAPGERFAFSSRLDVPKNGVKTVSVTFVD